MTFFKSVLHEFFCFVGILVTVIAALNGVRMILQYILDQ